MKHRGILYKKINRLTKLTVVLALLAAQIYSEGAYSQTSEHLQASLSSKPICEVSGSPSEGFSVDETATNTDFLRKWAILDLILLSGRVTLLSREKGLENPSKVLYERIEKRHRTHHRGHADVNSAWKVRDLTEIAGDNGLAGFFMVVTDENGNSLPLTIRVDKGETCVKFNSGESFYITEGGLEQGDLAGPGPQEVLPEISDFASEERVLPTEANPKEEYTGYVYSNNLVTAISNKILKIRSAKRSSGEKRGVVVAIDGYIGAGKTFLSENLKRELNLKNTPGVLIIHVDTTHPADIQKKCEMAYYSGEIAIVEGLGSFTCTDDLLLKGITIDLSIFVTADLLTRLKNIFRRSVIEMPFAQKKLANLPLPERVFERTLDYFMGGIILFAHSVGSVWGSFMSEVKDVFSIRKVVESADLVVDTSKGSILKDKMTGEGPGTPSRGQKSDSPGYRVSEANGRIEYGFFSNEAILDKVRDSDLVRHFSGTDLGFRLEDDGSRYISVAGRRLDDRGKFAFKNILYRILRNGSNSREIILIPFDGSAWESGFEIFDDSGCLVSRVEPGQMLEHTVNKIDRINRGSKIFTEKYLGTDIADHPSYFSPARKIYTVRKTENAGRFSFNGNRYNSGNDNAYSQVYLSPIKENEGWGKGFLVYNKDGLLVGMATELGEWVMLAQKKVVPENGRFHFQRKRYHISPSHGIKEVIMVPRDGMSFDSGVEIYDASGKFFGRSLSRRPSGLRKVLSSKNMTIENFEDYLRVYAKPDGRTSGVETDISVARGRFEGRTAKDIGESVGGMSETTVLKIEKRICGIAGRIPEPEIEANKAMDLRDTIRCLSERERKGPQSDLKLSSLTIVGLGTDWIKSYQKKNSSHSMAIRPFLSDLRKFCEKNGILLVIGADKDLSSMISSECSRRNIETSKDNTLILARVFKNSRNRYSINRRINRFRRKNQCTLIGIETKRPDIEGYLPVAEILEIAIKIMSGDNLGLKDSDMVQIKPPGKTRDFYILVPDTFPLDYETYREIYRLQKYA